MERTHNLAKNRSLLFGQIHSSGLILFKKKEEEMNHIVINLQTFIHEGFLLLLLLLFSDREFRSIQCHQKRQD